jgi:hypothetical protein
MEKAQFSIIRKQLGKTQKELADLLGMSLKTIHSYEQGWRAIPGHIQRQLYYFLVNQRTRQSAPQPCWEQRTCTIRDQCPAWEFNSGHQCWFLCGTLGECGGDISYQEKIDHCRTCKVFQKLID